MKYRKSLFLFFCLLTLASIAILTKSQLKFDFSADSFLSKQEKTYFQDAEGLKENLILLVETVDSETLKNLEKKLNNPLIENVLSERVMQNEKKKSFFRIEPQTSLFFIEPAYSERPSIEQSRAFLDDLDALVRPVLISKNVAHQWIGGGALRTQLHNAFYRDLKYIILPAFILILIFPYLLYRSWAYFILPSCIGLFTLLSTLALYALFGKQFNYFSLTLGPLLLALSVLDAMFIIDGGVYSKDIQKTVRYFFLPCSLTSLTTAIGFASVSFVSNSPALREYGLFAAIGLAIAWVTTFTLLPALLHYWPAFSKRSLGRLRNVEKGIIFCVKWGMRYRYLVWGFFIFLSLFSILYVKNISLAHSFENIFTENVSAQKGIDQVAKHWGGLFPLKLKLHSKKSEGSSRLRYWMFSRHLENWLLKEGWANRSLMPADFVEPLLIERRADEPAWIYMQRVEKLLESADYSDVKEDPFFLTIWPSKRAKQDFSKFWDSLDSFEKNMMGEFKIQKSGLYLLREWVSSRFVREAIYSFGFSALLILVLTLMLLGSWKFSLPFILVNSLPLLFVAGLLGWQAIPFSIGLIGLPSILLGIAVDDTFQTLWACKKGGSVEKAYLKKGRGVVLTSFLLMIAFGSFSFSVFVANRQLGVLMAVGIFIALVADLFLLPTLLPRSNQGLLRR